MQNKDWIYRNWTGSTIYISGNRINEGEIMRHGNPKAHLGRKNGFQKPGNVLRQGRCCQKQRKEYRTAIYYQSSYMPVTVSKSPPWKRRHLKERNCGSPEWLWEYHEIAKEFSFYSFGFSLRTHSSSTMRPSWVRR